MLPGNLFWKKFHDAIAEAAKALAPYFDVLHVGFVKRPCDAILMFCSCVLDARMKTCEETEAGLLIKCLYIKKKLHNEIRSGNLIILILQKCAYFV